ncbi:MAG: hypothetical protein V7785_19980 [Bermanella sp.]
MNLLGLNASQKGGLWILAMLLLVGCGSGGSAEQETPVGFKSETEIAPNSSFVSEAGSDGQSDSMAVLTSREFQQTLALDPIAGHRCDFPQDEKFTQVADALGGFSKPYGIPMARNEALARFYTGRQPYSDDIYAQEAVDDVAGVTIERGDLIGQYQNTAFYLANPHGLMAINVNPDDAALSEVSCVFTLPGKPLNFYMDEDRVIVLVNSLGPNRHSAIFTLKWKADAFEFEQALLLPKASIKDSRRFNNSLVLMGNYYLNQPDIDADANQELSASNTYVQPINHLSNVALDNSEQGDVTLAWQETFNSDENSYYNSFLSATDEYLVLSAKTREQVGIKTGRYSFCKTYGPPQNYEYCSVKWKKVVNPDYVAPTPNSGGVLACGNDLMACLSQQGPKLSPFIYQRDGQTCHTYSRTPCTNYDYKTYQRPIYQDYTDFRIYRFVNGNFIRLDETMSVLSDNELKLSEDKIRIEGRIDGHEYLQFKNGFFYALSRDGVLSSFTIQGNSIIATASLSGLANNSRIASVEFSEDHIILGKSGGFQTLSLANPENPQVSDFIPAPGQLNQLIFDDDYILGFGSISLDIGAGQRNYFEKISLFSLFTSDGDSASEVDNYLVGSDLANTQSVANYDDQAFQYDSLLNRLFLPIQSYGWLEDKGYVSQDRLAIIEREQGLLTVPQVLEFPEALQRSVSMGENHALALSKNYIHQLSKQSSWSTSQLQKLNIPQKVYPIPQSDYWMVYQENEQGVEIYANNKDELFSTPAHASLEVAAAISSVCINESLHFANDLVIQVSEKEGLFSESSDCSYSNYDSVFDYVAVKGWKFSEQNGFEIVNQAEVEAMYLQINQVRNQYCVLNPDNTEGEKIVLTDSQSSTDQFTCMDSTQFHEASEE